MALSAQFLSQAGHVLLTMTMVYVLHSEIKTSQRPPEPPESRSHEPPSPFIRKGVFQLLEIPRELRDQIYEEVLAFTGINVNGCEVRCRDSLHTNVAEILCTPGYRRPFVHYTHVEHSKSIRLHNVRSVTRHTRYGDVVSNDMPGLRTMRLLCRQVRQEIMQSFRRQEIAFEAVSEQGWRGIRKLWSDQQDAAVVANMRSFCLFLDVECSGRALKTRAKPVFKFEIVDSGERLVLLSCAQLAADQYEVLDAEVVRFLRRDRKIRADRFRGNDLIHAAEGLHYAEQKVRRARNRQLSKNDTASEAGFVLELSDKDIMPQAVDTTGMALKGDFKYEVLSVTAREIFGQSSDVDVVSSSRRAALALAELEEEELSSIWRGIHYHDEY